MPVIYLLLSIIYLKASSLDTNITSKDLYIKYIKYPTSVYTQQRFTVELEARILLDNDDYDIVTTYSNEKNIDILDEDIYWLPQGNENQYTTRITYKARDKDFILPTLKLAVTQYSKDIDFVTISPPKIKYNKIAINQTKFSNIIADDLKIKEIKVKQLNNKMLILITHIETVNGNLEEFYLKPFKIQKTESFEDHYPLQVIYYSVEVPNHLDSIEFDYYNTKLDTFVTVQLPIMLEEELVSTQTDLNPYDSNILFYKQASTLIIILVFLLFYVKTKHKIFTVFIFIFTIIFIKLVLPNEKILIKKNTKVYILPTKLSTVYKITNKNDKVEILIKRDNFIKVLFKNKHIGWIKENDI